MKQKFYEMFNVGKVKYLVNYFNGNNFHNDGSPFFDIATFSNKKKKNKYINNLKREGYTEK